MLLLYILPCLIFIVVTYILYHTSKNKNKNETKEFIKLMIPGLVIGISVFLFMKYKEHLLNEEPMMHGNFFE